MSSRSGHRSRSRSRSRESRKSDRKSRKDPDRPWLKTRSRSRGSSSSSSSRSRSSRRRFQRSRSKSPVRPVMSSDPKFINARVFVANVASNQTTSSELTDLFKKHGKIVDSLVHHNGYGFLQFVKEEDARKAVEAETGTAFHGKVLRCNMAAEGKKGARGGGGGNEGDRGANSVGGRGAGLLPRDDRRSPLRDAYGRPYDDPYMRDRGLPPPRDPRDLPARPRGPPRDFPPRDIRGMPLDLPPLPRDPRDLPPPPHDPYFDDPYRRPLPLDAYYDRYRGDPYRRAPYGLDPYRDPYRDPFGPDLLDPVTAPKKPVTVDCEIIIMTSDLRRYADMVENRLKSINVLTNKLVIREDRTIQQQVEDASRRSCLFAITINSQNEMHQSLTVNILHGVTQEHRNMPLDDAVSLVARSFEKFLTAEKEKLAAQTKEKLGEGGGRREDGRGSPLSKDMSYLLNLLADNRRLTVPELDKVIIFLQDKRQKAVNTEGNITAMPASSSGLQQAPPPPPPSYQQQQALTAHQQPTSQQQALTALQQPANQQQELQSKILSMFNGGSGAPSNNSLPQSTLTSHTTPLMPVTVSARPPPPPPPTQPDISLSNTPTTSVPLGPGVSGLVTPATLINFDNPTVQKALDNLIQSGPSLLKNITATATQGQRSWPGQGTTLATSQNPADHMAAPRPQRPMY